MSDNKFRQKVQDGLGKSDFRNSWAAGRLLSLREGLAEATSLVGGELSTTGPQP